MTTTHPHVSQAARDVIEDLGLTHRDERTGSGEHAQHREEGTPS